MEDKKEVFHYTYSAQRQDEIERIRRKYIPKEEDKLEQLRRLDRSVTQKGTIWSLVLGILGCLLFGTGMSLVLVLAGKFFVLGIIIGIAGMAVMGIAYPVFKKVTAKEKERIAPQILSLLDELEK